MSGGGGGEQTVGYRYYLGLHMGLCAGPVDCLTEIRVGDRTAWMGLQSASGVIGIEKPELFGGEDREGGLSGNVDVMMGEATQAANDYLASRQGGAQPAYRGILGLVYRGGMVASNNPYIKNWSAKVRRVLAGWQGAVFDPATAKIIVGTDVTSVGTAQPLFEFDTTFKYKVVPTSDVTDYSAVGYDDSAWASGSGPFADSIHPFEPLTSEGFNTLIAEGGKVWIRKTVSISASSSLNFTIYYDNLASLWVNGVPRSVNATGSWTAVSNNILVTGPATITIAMMVTDTLTGGDGGGGNRIYSALSATAAPTLIAANAIHAMNPAHIVYECLTNSEWGMGYSAANIDTASFTAAANTFYAEGLGLCMMWTRQDSIESFLQGVVNHAGAVIGQDRRTGLFVLKAIRGDYTVASLPVFDPGNVIALDSYQRASVVEAVNEVTVTFTDATTGKTGSVTVQNLANITSQGGVVASTKAYPGLPTADLATRTALRDLRAVSTPIARVRMRVNREGYNLLPGDVIRLTWPKLGVTDLVLRVLGISTGTLTAGEITIDASEDVYGLPSTTYTAQQPSGWTDPNTDPAPAANRLVEEAGYYELARTLSTTELSNLPIDAGFMSYVASRPSSDSLNFKVLTRIGAVGVFTQAGVGQFAPTATLSVGIDAAATSATLVNMTDVDMVDVGVYGVLGGLEFVRIDAINAATGLVTLGRGLFDTVAKAHSAGARLFFTQGYVNTDGVERLDADNVQVRLLPATGKGTLAEDSAPIDSIVLDQRHFRAYPPGRLRINTLAYPVEIIDAPLTVTWAHRSRLQQNLEGDETGNIGPEAGTTYTLALYNATTSALIQQWTGLTGTSQAMPALSGNYQLRVELWSVRDALASRQKHAYTFTYTNITRITTEALDRITTEAGDTITTE